MPTDSAPPALSVPVSLPVPLWARPSASVRALRVGLPVSALAHVLVLALLAFLASCSTVPETVPAVSVGTASNCSTNSGLCELAADVGSVYRDPFGVEWDGATVQATDGRPVVIAARGSGGQGVLVLAAYGRTWSDCDVLALAGARESSSGGIQPFDIPFVGADVGLVEDGEGNPGEVVTIALDLIGLAALTEAQTAIVAACSSSIVFDGELAGRLRSWAGQSIEEPARYALLD